MPAVLFGSISSVADTSELQRDASNRAFDAHGLGWRWDRDQYRSMLEGSGGKHRIAEYARSRGETVDAQAVHDTKSKLFQQSLTTAELNPRADVVDTITAAKAQGWKLGLVTTTSHANIVGGWNRSHPASRPATSMSWSTRTASRSPSPPRTPTPSR